MNVEWFKSHPYATGAIVIVGGAAVFIILRGRQSETNDGSGYFAGYDSTLMQLSAAADVQAAHDNATIQIAGIQAGVANSQINAQLEAYKTQGSTAVQLAQIEAETVNKKTEIQGLIFKTLFETARDEQLSNNELAKFAIDKQYSLAQSGVELAKRENRGKEGTNVVAMALGQGNIASYNSATAAQSIAGSMATASIISNIAGVVGGLFG